MLNWNCVSPKALAVALTLTLISGGLTPLRADGRKGSTKNPTTTAAKGGTSTAAGTATETENEVENENEAGGGGGNTGGTTTSGKNGGTSGKNSGGGGGTETRLRAKGVGTGTAGAAPELSGDYRVKGTEVRLKGEAENLSGLAPGSQVTFCLDGITTPLATSLVETEAGVNVAEFDLESKNGATNIPVVAANSKLSAFSGGTCGSTLIATATFQ
jgi:hypothetical protein